MTALAGSYLTVAEAADVLAHVLASIDERRTAFEAVSNADRAVLLRAAAADLDACAWVGSPADPEQGLAWPRVRAGGVAVGGAQGTAPAVVGAVTAWSTPGVPFEVYAAQAIQAGRRALWALGLDDRASIDADAQRGVTARSGPSGSIGLDLPRASMARARLDPDAAAHVRRLLAWGVLLA